MKRLVLLLLILCLPAYTLAAYKVYLKNGSEIPDVKTYSESGGDVYLYFSTGQMVVPRKDVLRIEGSEAAEPEGGDEETQPSADKPAPDVRPPQDRPSPSAPPAPAADEESKAGRLSELKTELDAINGELKDVQDQENKLVNEINTKMGRRFSYNLIQMKQLEKEVDPLKTELVNVQQRKSELTQRKASVESEIRQLQ